MADQVRIRGVQYDFTSCDLKIDGERYTGWTAIKWNQKRDRKKAYASGKHHAPRGRTRGQYSADLTITMWKDAAMALRAQLAAKSADGVSYGNPDDVPIVLQYIEDNQTPHVVEFFDCAYVGEAASEDEGGDASKEDITIDCMYMKVDGLTLFDNSDGLR